MKAIKGCARTRINFILPAVGGIFNGQTQTPGYFIIFCVKVYSVLQCFALHCEFQEHNLNVTRGLVYSTVLKVQCVCVYSQQIFIIKRSKATV
jgi:hypothetical protein